jgi:hypothetical protein
MEAVPEKTPDKSEKAAQLSALHRMEKIVVPKTPVPAGFGPSFMRALADPDTRNILMCGTGGSASLARFSVLIQRTKEAGSTFVTARFWCPS